MREKQMKINAAGKLEGTEKVEPYCRNTVRFFSYQKGFYTWMSNIYNMPRCKGAPHD